MSDNIGLLIQTRNTGQLILLLLFFFHLTLNLSAFLIVFNAYDLRVNYESDTFLRLIKTFFRHFEHLKLSTFKLLYILCEKFVKCLCFRKVILRRKDCIIMYNVIKRVRHVLYYSVKPKLLYLTFPKNEN